MPKKHTRQSSRAGTREGSGVTAVDRELGSGWPRRRVDDVPEVKALGSGSLRPCMAPPPARAGARYGGEVKREARVAVEPALDGRALWVEALSKMAWASTSSGPRR